VLCALCCVGPYRLKAVTLSVGVGTFRLSVQLLWLQNKRQRLEMALIPEQVRRSGGLLAVDVGSGRVGSGHSGAPPPLSGHSAMIV
jgi:hypothetical protein